MRPVLLALLLAAVAAPALAQDAPAASDGWDVASDPTREMTIASVGYTNGLTLAVRCMANKLDVLIAGLPPAARTAEQPVGLPTRPLALTFPGAAEEPQNWYVAGDGVAALAAAPRPNARRLRRAGSLEIKIPPIADQTAPALRYVLDLPGSSAGVDQVLAACDQPLTDPRDDLPRVTSAFPGPSWDRLPRPQFPESVLRDGVTSGRVHLSCILGDGGRPVDCQTEDASDPRFARPALAAMRDTRLKLDAAPPSLPGQIFFFTITFRVTR